MSRHLLQIGVVLILALATAGVAQARGPRGGAPRSRPAGLHSGSGMSRHTRNLRPRNVFMASHKSALAPHHHHGDHHGHHHHHHHHLHLGGAPGGGEGSGGGPAELASGGEGESEGSGSADFSGADEEEMQSTGSVDSRLVSASTADADEADAEANDAAEASDAEWQAQRYMKVENDSGKTVKVYLQYHTVQDDGRFAWLPADPEKSQKTVSFILKPGEIRKLATQDGPIAANRVRFWAVSNAKRWLQYKDKDLWLVPELRDDGHHRYQADEVETFTLTVPR